MIALTDHAEGLVLPVRAQPGALVPNPPGADEPGGISGRRLYAGEGGVPLAR